MNENIGAGILPLGSDINIAKKFDDGEINASGFLELTFLCLNYVSIMEN